MGRGQARLAERRTILDDGLPVPRLECRWELAGTRGPCSYSLVTRHLLGHVTAVLLGRTEVSGAEVRAHVELPDDRLALPFRDGAHIHHDMLHLGLPGFVRLGDRAQELERVPPHERTR